jgi:uridylate kinase
MIYVISLGGSILVPDNININFLKKFKMLIDEETDEGHKFIIIVGGGKTARKYQQAAKITSKISNEDLDWIGIHATRINAHLLLAVFRKKAYYRIIKNPIEKVVFKNKILIAAGWKPGFSTDYDAVLLAKSYNSDIVINLTNVDYVYNKDPNKFKDSKPFKEIRWRDYLKLIKNKWIPGMSSPFDPIASKLAMKYGIRCAVINGNKLNELKKFLRGQKFNGTLII